MKNLRSVTPAQNASVAHDEEMDKLVTEAEKQFVRRDRVQLVDLIDADTRGVLTLFPYKPREADPGKTYPVMTGHLDTKRVKIPVSAFARMTEEGRQFLSLSIGPQGQSHIGGAVFRQEDQNPTTGLWELTPGKENERHGVIAKTVAIDEAGQYDTVFELRFYGKRRITGAGIPFIKARVYPERGSSKAESAMEGCF